MITTMTIDGIGSNRGGVGHAGQIFAVYNDQPGMSASWRCEQGGPINEELWLRHGMIADDNVVYEHGDGDVL